MENIQDFIEKYYPNYDSCDTIAYESDLFKLMNDEYEDGSDAEQLLNECYEKDIHHIMIAHDWNKINRIILERTIEGFLNTKQN